MDLLKLNNKLYTVPSSKIQLFSELKKISFLFSLFSFLQYFSCFYIVCNYL